MKYFFGTRLPGKGTEEPLSEEQLDRIIINHWGEHALEQIKGELKNNPDVELPLAHSASYYLVGKL